MNILLTGGLGYIGSHIAISLIKNGDSIVLLDNLSNSNVKVLDRINKITGKTIQFVRCDICDTSELETILRNYKIDSVIHLAALKSTNESCLNPLNYYKNNIQGSISLLKAMELCGIKNLVFSSSATVYGEPIYLPIDEDHPINPINPYGKSKAYVEQIMKDITLSNSEWSIISLRYFNPVGADSSGLIGEDLTENSKNLMPMITQVAMKKKSELTIFGSDYQTPDGTGKRDYIHVMDLSDGHLAALNYLKKMKGFEVINLGTGISYSVKEIVNTFSIVSGVKIPYKYSAKREGDVPVCYASVSKAKKILNWESKRTLQQMCESSWIWANFNF